MQKSEEQIRIEAATEIVAAYLMRGEAEVKDEFNTGGDLDEEVIEAVRAAARFIQKVL